MSGDYSRDSFDPSKHYNRVRKQQGRIDLDADWNEAADIQDRRWRAETVDLIGRTGVPETTPDAFKIDFDSDPLYRNWLSVGRGRIYVDGLLAENHGALPGPLDTPRPFDRILDELYGQKPLCIAPPEAWQGNVQLPSGASLAPPTALIPQSGGAPGVTAQPANSVQPVLSESSAPFVPNALGHLAIDAGGSHPIAPLSVFPNSGIYLAYLEVWQREVDALQDPNLIDPAVGVDTTTRTKIEWKNRFLPLRIGTELPESGCNASVWDSESWTKICAPSKGRLTVTTTDVPEQENPCEQPPSGGYRGRENQLYRVEIHDVLEDGTADGMPRFKWSRENGSVATAVIEVVSNDEIRVASLGRDDVLGFQQGDWVEILSDDDELAADAIRSGFMARITAPPSGNTLKLHLPDSYSDALAGWKDNPDQIPTKHLRVRRWDQKPGPEKLGHANDGLIQVELGKPVELEAGIQVQFSVQNGIGGPDFRPGDYWIFPARAADSSVEELTKAPPAGIHHYCPLALVDFNSHAVRDCRVKFPPLTDTLSLFYLGGSGQVVTTPSDGTSIKLPLPFSVGVSRGCLPVCGAKVTFRYAAMGERTESDVFTNEAGIADFYLIVDGDGVRRARAMLFNNWDIPVHLPVWFFAVAQQRHIAPAIHVTGVYAIGEDNKRYKLQNDIAVPVNFAARGFDIECDRVVDPKSVTPVSCLFVCEPPGCFFGGYGDRSSLYRQAATIKGSVTATESTIRWRPPNDGTSSELLYKLLQIPENDSPILLRIILRGHLIWSHDEPIVYLDGASLGHNIDGLTNLDSPSGIGRPPSDFEFWFWLTPYSYEYPFGLGEDVPAIGGDNI